MARKRTIDPSFWKNNNVAKLNMLERLLFMGIFSNADDEGKGEADPAYLRSTIFPYDDISLKEIINGINKICKYMNIIFYEVNSVKYYKILNWKKWQSINKKQKSKIPEPLDENVNKVNDVQEPLRDKERNDYGSEYGSDYRNEYGNDSGNESEPIPEPVLERVRNDSNILTSKHDVTSNSNNNLLSKVLEYNINNINNNIINNKYNNKNNNNININNNNNKKQQHQSNVCYIDTEEKFTSNRNVDVVVDKLDKKYKFYKSFQFFESNIAKLGSYVGKQMLHFVDKLGDDVVVEALKKAMENNVRTWNYIAAILRNWDNNNVRSVADVKELDAKFRKSKEQSKYNSNLVNKIQQRGYFENDADRRDNSENEKSVFDKYRKNYEGLSVW